MLNPGAKFGPYEIVSPLGAGGMGEVYRARDTRLERDVAIKVLPASLAADPALRQRLEREAKAISKLSHPHICTLYDIGHQDGMDFLVMELVEGETLEQRLTKGPLSPEQTVRCAAQIADALAKAHKLGIVHRDLKPSNVMLTKSGAKLMDFGLAKQAGPAPLAQALTEMTLEQSKLTGEGKIVGTFQYMAPEQLEGKEVDARTDIFALGEVIYEMATGKPAFGGKSRASLIAAILTTDPPPITQLQPMTPPALERVVKKCLAKDPEDRWQSASDLTSELNWILEGGSQAGVPAPVVSKRKTRERLAWTVAGVALIVAIGFTAAYFTGQKPASVLRAQLVAPGKSRFNFVGDNAGPIVISPDGGHVVFSAITEGKSQLQLRALNSTNAQPLPGTEDAIFPFWSPDSRSIAFFQGGKLKRIEIAGGPPITVAEIDGNGRGGSWGKEGTIVYSPRFSAGIFAVPAKGGSPTPVTQLGDPRYTTHRWPWFLPDGKHFLYLAANHNSPNSEDMGVFYASLDGKENRLVVHTAAEAIYAAGYLLFLRENALMAQAFDPSRGKLTGDPVALADEVQYDASVWRTTVTASEDGTLIYQPGVGSIGRRLVWYDRSGKELAKVGERDTYYNVQLSPDEKKLALTIGAPFSSLWTYELSRDIKTRLTFDPQNFRVFAWSADGKQIAYSAARGSGRSQLYLQSATVAGEAKPLLEPKDKNVDRLVCDWSPDDRYLLYTEGTGGLGNAEDLWVLPLFGDEKPFSYLRTPASEHDAQFSPDGRWIAYSSNQTGRYEIFVAPFPWTGAKWQVSTTGGELARWRRDGKELFFVSGDNHSSRRPR